MKSYKISVRSDFPEWSRYNVYMTAVCFDAQNNTTDYVNTTRESPADNTPLTLTTPPCARADLYLYVVAREFPASDSIASSPPFPIEVLITENAGATTTKTTHEVNQWGGLSIKLSMDN